MEMARAMVVSRVRLLTPFYTPFYASKQTHTRLCWEGEGSFVTVLIFHKILYLNTIFTPLLIHHVKRHNRRYEAMDFDSKRAQMGG
jgi:hypothetical protein